MEKVDLEDEMMRVIEKTAKDLNEEQVDGLVRVKFMYCCVILQ